MYLVKFSRRNGLLSKSRTISVGHCRYVSGGTLTALCRLRDGRSIRTVSALLLQLVQTSAHDVRIEAQNLRISRQQLAVRTNHNDYCADTPLDDNDSEVYVTFVRNSCCIKQESQEMRLYINGLDSATKAAKTVVIFLTQRYVNYLFDWLF